ncbi:hypothetical protein ACFQ6N_30415 [Kitasatospora sp. NPDC056446]|uniref:hypothetical protein n=1 Tax=Kitasatospora sp. NPDC056446 TaxID=3345819 RepID=UPI00367899BA
MKDLRAILITDVHDGRLHLGERVILLAGPARERLSAYLDHRARRWPRTADPHLFINVQTAYTTAPTSNVWATKILGISAQAIREDRILDEILAFQGDIRRLWDLFGLSSWGARRYAEAAAQSRVHNSRPDDSLR